MPSVLGSNVPPAVKYSSRARSRISQTPPRTDLHYGQQEIASICARYIIHLFKCPLMPSAAPTNPQARLDYFIAYAIHRTRLPSPVVFSALVLLSRLKARFPAAKGSSGHRLFISAFMIASKVLCDDTFSNKSWHVVGQSIFSLREINQMEHEMVSYLDWELTVDRTTLDRFQAAVKTDFSNDNTGRYPKYPMEMISKRARDAASPSKLESSHPSIVDSYPRLVSSLITMENDDPVPTSPPEPSYSNSTSPATTASPETPITEDGFNLIIAPHQKLSYKAKQQFSLAVPASW